MTTCHDFHVPETMFKIGNALFITKHCQKIVKVFFFIFHFANTSNVHFETEPDWAR